MIIDQDFTESSQASKYMWEYANFSPGKSVEFPEPKVSKYREISILIPFY